MANLKATVFPTVGSGILLGSITGIIKNHLLSKLPKGYIKYTYIKNSIPSVTEQNVNEEDVLIKERPALSLGLNYSYNDAVFTGDTFRWGMSKIPVGAYQYDSIYTKVLMCEQDGIYISAIDERVKLTYEVGVRLDSESQAYNLLQYMKSYIGVARPYYLQHIDVEVPIPFESIDLVATAKKFDRSTQAGLLALHDYLKKWSGGRITFKKNLSSGNFNYFLKYNANVLCKIPDIPTIEKNVEGKSVINADVRYSLEIEFPTFTNFITEYEEGLPVPVNGTPELVDGGRSAIYNFTSKLQFTRQLGDKNLAVTFEFVTDVNKTIDETDFREAIPEALDFFITHQKQLLVTDPQALSRHLQIIVLRDDELMKENEDFTVDWPNQTVRVMNPWFNYIYRMAIYVDMVKYNEILMIHDSLKLMQHESIKKVAEVQEGF